MIMMIRKHLETFRDIPESVSTLTMTLLDDEGEEEWSLMSSGARVFVFLDRIDILLFRDELMTSEKVFSIEKMRNY